MCVSQPTASREKPTKLYDEHNQALQYVYLSSCLQLHTARVVLLSTENVTDDYLVSCPLCTRTDKLNLFRPVESLIQQSVQIHLTCFKDRYSKHRSDQAQSIYVPIHSTEKKIAGTHLYSKTIVIRLSSEILKSHYIRGKCTRLRV